MPRRRPWKGRKPVYWWTPEIAELRKECHRARRKEQRARDRPEAAVLSQEHKDAKHRLAKAIRQSKARCLRSLREDVNKDPWGLGYKVVMGKLNRGSDNMMDAASTERIVSALFPERPIRENPVEEIPREEVPLFSEGEMVRAIKAMKNGKAPGPDGIPAEVLKRAVKVIPGILLSMFNACLAAGVFPKQWKVARLVLLNKGKGGAPDSPSSYRPLCMLNTIGKVMESMLRARLRKAIEEGGGLSEEQHGFREGHSTIDAIRRVVDTVEAERKRGPAKCRDVLLVTLDVKNAFNSARWDDMIRSLEYDFQIPRYLGNVLKDYLRDRRLLYDTLDGRRERILSAGIAQGSVLGPDLWNAFYDGLLRVQLPEGVSLIGYADDVAMTITGRDTEVTQERLNLVMGRINLWMGEHGLQLAIPKTEIVLLTRRRVPTDFDVIVDDGGIPHTIRTRTSVKYLGVQLDNKLTFWEQFQRSCEKAASVASSLSRLMANIGGPKPGKRSLLMSVVNSVLLYGSEVWAKKTEIAKHRRKISSVQRQAALRIACAYQTVSLEAIQVVASVIPIDLLALERKFIYESMEDREVASTRARFSSMRAWQERWEQNEKDNSRWTRTLIPDVRAWVGRQHGEVDFYLTQFLTGHGYFRVMLEHWHKVATKECLYCPGVDDTVEHTFFECVRYAEGRPPFPIWRPEEVVPEMLRSSENWNKVAEYVRTTLLQKKEEGFLS